MTFQFYFIFEYFISMLSDEALLEMSVETLKQNVDDDVRYECVCVCVRACIGGQCLSILILD